MRVVQVIIRAFFVAYLGFILHRIEKAVRRFTTAHGRTTKTMRPYWRVGRSPVRMYFTAFSALEAAETNNRLSDLNFLIQL